MSIPIKQTATRRREIFVIAEDEKPAKQPHTFQFCPLGVQCYCHRKMDEYQVVDFNMQFPSNDGTTEEIECSGIVVACNEDKHSALYRVWIKFVNISERTHSKIHEVAASSEFLCPFCENY